MKRIIAVIACLAFLSSAQAQWNPAKSISDAGKNISNAGKNAGKNISNAGKNAGKNISDAGKNAGKSVSNAGKNAGKSVSNAGKSAGKSISNAGKSAGKNVSNSAKQLESSIQHAPPKSTQKHPKPDTHKAGIHKTDQKLGTHKPGQKDSNPPVSTGQKNAQRGVQPANTNAPVIGPGVIGIDTNPQPAPAPVPSGFSFIPWQDAYPKPINNGQLSPAKAGTIGVQIPPGGQGGSSGGTYTNKDGTRPPILQDPAGFFSNLPFGP